MGVDGCCKCVKVALMVFNFVFFLVGAGGIGLGAWVLVNSGQVLDMIALETDTIDIPLILERGAYFLIATGALILLISALGFLGTCKENRCLLATYGIIVLLLLALEITAVVLAVIFKDKVENNLTSFLNDTLVEHYDGLLTSNESFSVLWDGYQISSECCGLKDQNDYLYARKWDRQIYINDGQDAVNMVIPPSCCKFEDTSKYPDDIDNLKPVEFNCTTAPTNQNAWLDKGCYSHLKSDLGFAANIVLISGVVVATTELIGIILAFCLCRAAGKGNKVV